MPFKSIALHISLSMYTSENCYRSTCKAAAMVPTTSRAVPLWAPVTNGNLDTFTRTLPAGFRRNKDRVPARHPPAAPAQGKWPEARVYKKLRRRRLYIRGHCNERSPRRSSKNQKCRLQRGLQARRVMQHACSTFSVAIPLLQ